MLTQGSILASNYTKKYKSSKILIAPLNRDIVFIKKLQQHNILQWKEAVNKKKCKIIMQSLIFLSVDREVDQKFFVIIFSTRNIQQDDILIFWMCCWEFLKNVNFFVYNLSCQSWVIGLTSDSIFTFGKTHQMRKLLSGQIDCVTLICTNRILPYLYILYIRFRKNNFEFTSNSDDGGWKKLFPLKG